MLRTKLALLGLAVVLVAGCAGPPGPIQAVPLADIQKAAPSVDQAKAIATFGEQLFAQVREGGEPNPVISPLSVFYALGMAGDGAAGDTAAAFEKVLGLTAEQARQVAAYLLAELSEPGEGTTLSSAQSVWLDDQFTVKQDWVDRVAAYYRADAIRTDLANPGAAGLVNAWINQKTNGLIPSMLDSLDPDAVALLVNALYLKADWARTFDTNDTTQGTFTTESGAEVEAYYLSATLGSARYLDTGSATGIVLPYKDGRLGFLAAMPKSGQLALDGSTIAGLLAAAKDQSNVELRMPKFDTKFGADLAPALSELGLGVAFEGTADFSAMTSESVRISRALHKVSMSVGEKGTEAAAATVVEMVPTSAQLDEPLLLSFNRPYVYAVVDLTTGVPLFVGAMDDPSKAPPAAR